MKVLFYNLNRGRNDLGGLINFLNSKKNLIDVFCFQEYENEIEESLDKVFLETQSPNFHIFTKYKVKMKREKGDFDNCIFISSRFQKHKFYEVSSKDQKTPPIIWVSFLDGNSKWNILNFHGLPEPGDKLDTEERILASQKIIEISKNLEGKVIVGGDFNLLPETKSIELFEENNFSNLIKDFKIETTRNENAWKLHPDNKQIFADYIFTSKNCNVLDFEVPKNLYSDHLPMIVEIS